VEVTGVLTGSGLRYAVLSMTVDKPTRMEPVYELL